MTIRGSGIKAGAAYVELYSKDAGFTRGLQAAERHLDSLGATAIRMGAGFLAASGIIAGGATLATRNFAETGDMLEKMSRRTGFSVEALSELGFAAEQSGTDIAALEKAIRTMQRSILDAGRGLSTQTDALDAMGVSIDDLLGKTPEDQFETLAQALSDVEDPTIRAGLAAQFFGRAGTQLLPLIEDGVSGMRALRKEAEDLGLTIDTKTAVAAASLTDALNISRRVVKDLVFEIGGALAPSLDKTLRVTAPLVKRLADWISQNEGVVRSVASLGIVLGILGGGLITVGVLLKLLALAAGGFAAIIVGAGTAVGLLGSGLSLLATPLGVATGLVAALGGAWVSESNRIDRSIRYIVGRYDDLKTSGVEVYDALVAAFTSGQLELASQILWKSIQVAWKSGATDLLNVWYELRASVLNIIADLADGVSKVVAAVNVGGFAIEQLAEQVLGGLVSSLPFGSGVGLGAFIAADTRKDDREKALDSLTGTSEIGDSLRFLAQEFGARAPELTGEIQRLQGELRELIEQSKNGSSAVRQAPRGFEGTPLGSGVGNGFQTRGVFLSSAIRSLAGAGDTVQRAIQQNTKDAADRLDDLKDEIERQNDGGVYFA